MVLWKCGDVEGVVFCRRLGVEIALRLSLLRDSSAGGFLRSGGELRVALAHNVLGDDSD